MRKYLFVFFVSWFVVSQADANPGESSFTPASIRMPIRELGLISSATAMRKPLYICAANTESGCMVDVADVASLSALVPANLSVPAAVYDQAYISTCISEGSYHAQVKGSVSLGGTRYYTAAGANPLTSIALMSDYTTVSFNGCKRIYQLPQALDLTAPIVGTVNISLFSWTEDMAWARLGTAPIQSGCLNAADGSQSVCLAYPDVVPAVGSAIPSVEKYFILDGMNPPVLAGQLLLVTDSSMNILAGFARRYYDESIQQGMNGGFDTPIKKFSTNADGSIYLENYGNTAVDTGYLRFDSFLRKSHAGTYLSQSGTPVDYYAYRDYQRELPHCSAGPLFTQSPISFGDFTTVEPLGHLRPSGHVFPTDHIYFALNIDGTGSAISVPVYAPGNIWVTSIIQTKVIYEDSTSSTEYQIDFSPCREVSARFGHIETASPAIMSLYAANLPNPAIACEHYSTGGREYTNCKTQQKSPLVVGTNIGTAGGSSKVFGFDFRMYDARTPPLAFANPGFGSKDRLHTVCPIDYFDSVTKASLYALFGVPGTLRTIPPLCGTIQQDIPGTAQGNWFVPGPLPKSEDPNIALVHDNVNPTIGAFSVGTAMLAFGLPSEVYYFTPTSNPSQRVNRDFSTVTNDGFIYCYEATEVVTPRVFLLQMPTSTSINFEYKAGVSNCAALGTPANWSLSNYGSFLR